MFVTMNLKKEESMEEKQVRKYLKPIEVADIVGVDIKTVYSWTEEGKIPYVKIVGSIRIPRERFYNWLEKKISMP